MIFLARVRTFPTIPLCFYFHKFHKDHISLKIGVLHCGSKLPFTSTPLSRRSQLQQCSLPANGRNTHFSLHKLLHCFSTLLPHTVEGVEEKKRIYYTGYTRELFDKKRVAKTQRNGKQWHLRGKEKNLRGKKKILRGTQDDAPPKQVASYSTLPRIALPTTANLLHREGKC